MKKLAPVFIVCPLLSIAQNISGTVVSQDTNLPVENTNILALSSKTGTITNERGKFSLHYGNSNRGQDLSYWKA